MLGFLLVSDDDFTVDPDDAAKVLTADSGRVLQAAEAALAGAEPWTAEAIEAALQARAARRTRTEAAGGVRPGAGRGHRTADLPAAV